MQNDGVPSARFSIISEGNTSILHFAFSILHLPEGQKNDLLSVQKIGPPSGGPYKEERMRSLGF